MTEQEAMQILADMSLHEGGMDNWVPDNAWYRFANVVEAKVRDDERDRACAYMRQMHDAYSIASYPPRGTT
jgi:hypothetical protein